MSEDGWKAFLKAEGLNDWAVLHGGPTAVYRVKSLSDAAGLAQAFSQVANLDAKLTQISITTVSYTHLTLPTNREV